MSANFFNCQTRSILVLCLISFFSFNPVKGQKIDKTFNPLFKSISRITAISAQPDGKLLIAGSPMSVGQNAFKNVCRLNADGTLDPSFNFNANKDSYINNLIIREDGKILIAGQGVKTDYRDMLLLNPDGSIDPAFNLDERISSIIDVLPLPDSSYLVASFTLSHPIVKIKSDGTLDENFNIGTGPNGLSLYEYGMVLQGDKIIIVGSFTQFNNTPAGGIARINLDGSIDNTFIPGTGANFNDYDAGIMDIALQKDNKIILTGRFNSFNGNTANYIVRLMPDGQIDTDFVRPGPAPNIFSYEISKSIVDPADGILLLGYKSDYPFSHEKIVRLNPDGSLDNSFTLGSMLISGYSDVVDMFRNNQGDLFISGQFSTYNDIPRNNLVKINSTGQLDGFNPGIGGIATINTIARQPDGKLLVGGDFLEVNGNPAGRIARLNPDGSSDSAFNYNIGTGANFPVNKIVVQNDGRILVGGNFTSFKNTTRQLFLRLNDDGTLDESFNPNVWARYVGLGVNDILLQDSRIIIGGLFDQAGNAVRHNLAGFKYNGDLDSAFNASDLLVVNDLINSITEQSDKKLIIGGYKYFNQGDAILLRTTPDGQSDNTFNGDFIHPNIKINKIQVLPDDKIIFVGGNSRYSASYVPVPVFQLGKDGGYIDSLSIGIYNGEVRDIEITDSSSIFLAGDFDKVNNILHPSFVKTSLHGNIFDFDLAFPDNPFSKIVVNDIFKLDSAYWLLGGNFNTILGDEDHVSLAKIKIADQLPVIRAISGNLSTPEDSPYTISLNDLTVSDADDYFPSGFSFSILPGTNYSVKDSSVVPSENFNGILTVSVTVNDGFENSVPFQFELNVTPVNDIPVINAINTDTIFAVNKSLTLDLADFSVSDPDNKFPDDFTIIISEGDHYRVSGTTITPEQDYTGLLNVRVAVNDGSDNSEPFLLRLQVAEITGLAGEPHQEDFKIYPNPVGSEQLTIEGKGVRNDGLISIRTISGQVVEVPEYFDKDSGSISIDVSHISPGLYMVNLESKGKYYTGIFIKK